MEGGIARRRPSPRCDRSKSRRTPGACRRWRSRRPGAGHRGSGPALGAGDGVLELVLAHLGAALDVELPGLLLQLTTSRCVTAADRVGLLAQRAARGLRQVLKRVLIAS